MKRITTEERFEAMIAEEKKAFGRKGSIVEADQKTSTSIIAKKAPHTTDINSILQSMVNSVPSKINLVQVLHKELSDPLLKYTNSEGNIESLKITDELYIVAIVHKLITIGNQSGWDIARENDFIYLFTGKYWIECPKDNLYRFFEQIVTKMNFYSPAKAATTAFKDKLYKQFISSANFYSPVKKNGTVLLNCQNGTLEVTSSGIKLKAHDKSDFIKYVLPFEYNPKAPAPIFERYLNEVLDRDSQNIIQEFCGYVFDTTLKLEKCLVCYGSGANGKSVFFEVITSLLGGDNISSYSLGDLTDKNQGSYNRAMIKDKLINYGSEIKGNNIDADLFKRLVSGEPTQARLPYGQPFTLHNNIKLMFNANEYPSINEHNEAIYRRFILIPFEKTIPVEKRDAQLHSKIIESELSGILNWILIGLARLLNTKRFTESEKSIEALNQYRTESDTVALFLTEQNYKPSYNEDDFRSTSSIFNEYQTETKENGQYPLSKTKFVKRLKALGFVDHRQNNIRGFLLSNNE